MVCKSGTIQLSLWGYFHSGFLLGGNGDLLLWRIDNAKEKCYI